MKAIENVNALVVSGASAFSKFLGDISTNDAWELRLERFTNEITEKLHAGGKLIITGVGKNYWMSTKLAATAQSLNIPALAFDVVHALHGDLGVVQPNDIIWGFSKSGSTAELSATMEYIKEHSPVGRFENVLLLGTKMGEAGTVNSMDEWADDVICVPQLDELDEWNKVPSVSLLAMQLVADAIIIAVASRLHGKNFELSDFQITHPGGRIGGKN